MSHTALPVVTLLLALALTACAAGDDIGMPPTPSPTAQPTPTPTLEPTLEPTEPDPIDTDDGEEAEIGRTTITGMLGGDADLEGGCAWLDGKDGSRYEVQYPEGYDVTRDGSELRGPDGEVLARAGDTVTVTGEVAEDMMSFCQVGIIFRASTVEVDA